MISVHACKQVIPEGRKVRILEVCTGMPQILPAAMKALGDLAQRIDFTCTAHTPELVAQWRQAYGAQYPSAAFKLLDIEQDLVPQVGCRFLQLWLSCE